MGSVAVVNLAEVEPIDLPLGSWSRMLVTSARAAGNRASLGYSVYRAQWVAFVVAGAVFWGFGFAASNSMQQARLIGAMSAPQAAVFGFRDPYMVPDAATAALGILLAMTILATAGRMGGQDPTPETSMCLMGKPSGARPRPPRPDVRLGRR